MPVATVAEPEKFLTVAELCRRWKIGRTTVYNEIARGRLAKTLIGGSVRFAIAEIERYERVA